MKNTFGTSVAVTLIGESHGEYIGAVLDGLAPGIDIDHDDHAKCDRKQYKHNRKSAFSPDIFLMKRMCAAIWLHGLFLFHVIINSHSLTG